MNNDYVTEKCYDRIIAMIRSEMVNKREQMTYDTSRKERFTDSVVLIRVGMSFH